jgi:3-phenylpropionate/cinnamic acid dioxygenase small subunit
MASELENKDAIREVLAEYCFRLDGGRFDEMAALFTEDGTWDTAFGAATGRPAIAAQAARLRTGPPQPRPRGIHLTTNIVIALDGAKARVRSNWMVATNSPEGPKIGSGGGYADEMVKTAEGWRFKIRKIDRFIKAD